MSLVGIHNLKIASISKNLSEIDGKETQAMMSDKPRQVACENHLTHVSDPGLLPDRMGKLVFYLSGFGVKLGNVFNSKSVVVRFFVLLTTTDSFLSLVLENTQILFLHI